MSLKGMKEFKELSHWHNILFDIRYQLLLLALLCVFVVNIFFPDNIYGSLAQLLYLPFQLFACFLIFESKKRLLYILIGCAVLLAVLKFANSFLTKSYANEMAFVYICFYGSAFLEVMRQIYLTNLGSLRIILAGICGLLMIGYCGFYIFLVIEYYQPGSFNNLGHGATAVNDLFYFSYITILTVGYGTITPATWVAKNATVLVALVAYIYSWVVIATIVGEAMGAKQSLVQKKAAKNDAANELRGERESRQQF